MPAAAPEEPVWARGGELGVGRRPLSGLRDESVPAVAPEERAWPRGGEAGAGYPPLFDTTEEPVPSVAPDVPAWTNGHRTRATYDTSADTSDGIDAYYGWDNPARPTPDPVDPLDPSAPIDTRWLDAPDVTTAWEAVGGDLLPDLQPTGRDTSGFPWSHLEPTRLEPTHLEPAPPEPPAPSESGPRNGAAAEPESFWARFGLEEPTASRSDDAAHRGSVAEPPAAEGPAAEPPVAELPVVERAAPMPWEGSLWEERARTTEPPADPVGVHPLADQAPGLGGWGGGWPSVTGSAPVGWSGASNGNGTSNGTSNGTGNGTSNGASNGAGLAFGAGYDRSRHNTPPAEAPSTGRRRRRAEDDEVTSTGPQPVLRSVADLTGGRPPKGRHRRPGDEV